MVYKSNNSVYISGSCKKRTGTVSNVMTIVTLPVSVQWPISEHNLLLEYAVRHRTAMADKRSKGFDKPRKTVLQSQAI